jgi:hypothetical protein
MSNYSSKDLRVSVLKFFCLDAQEQIEYAQMLPSEAKEKKFPCDLDHSPLLELADGTYNIARILTDGNEAHPAYQGLEELHALAQVIVCANGIDMLSPRSLRDEIAWRLLRKVARACLRELGLPLTVPTIPCEELIPFIMD